MAKGQVLTTKDLPKAEAIQGPTHEEKADTTKAKVVRDPVRADGMVRLQQMIPGVVCYGGTSEKSANGRRTVAKPLYKWSGVGVQTVPLAVARDIICKFRNRFRALDPM
jgi:hypothetical protein